MAKPKRKQHAPPPGQVPLPVLLTGSMGMLLAVGLHAVGLLDGLDESLAAIVSEKPAALSPALPTSILWLATAAVSYGVALVILEIPGMWRRIVIWLSTLAVIIAWLPVAAIAQQHAAIAAPLVAAVWAGLCTLIYASRHHMEVDDAPPRTKSTDAAN